MTISVSVDLGIREIGPNISKAMLKKKLYIELEEKSTATVAVLVQLPSFCHK